MQYDKRIRISIGGSRKTSYWPRADLYWSEFAAKLQTPVRSPETIDAYLKLSKTQQDDLKDVGGFVGGTFRGDHRKACYLEGRDLLTLDMDNIPAGGTNDLLRRIGGLGCAAAVYSTRKHTGYAPRLRIVLPLDRTASADEYEPAARKAAEIIGIAFCDPTTFEGSRLMYWPSCCSDSEYVCEIFDRPFCSLDGLLNMYADWREVGSWPQVPGSEAITKRKVAKQEDPITKRGIIGAFCRTYTVTEAMERFIPGMYEETSIPGRYTYTGGSTVGGAIIYDQDRFLFSHHATDPCSGQLVNAFDLVRLHKFGDRDAEQKDGTPANRLPSYTAMSHLAMEDEAVSARMAQERMQKARDAFGEAVKEEKADDDLSWINRLTKDGNGRIEKTINNAVIVLENDPDLVGKIAVDEFAGCGLVLGKLPWDSREEVRRWEDVDYAGYYSRMELFYAITGRDKLDNALLLVSSANKINAVRDYLTSLTWDGVPRVDTLLHDYLGAEDNAYTRAVMRKSLCAAVARAIVGGVKYDYMPIITGPQGIGKSTFLRLLGKDWFSDSLTTFEGKDAAELIQGTWINEIGELTAFTRQETQVIKQFLSKTDDIYRAAYGRQTKKYPRRCVFFGTSNDREFLKDHTGNRRFWPVDVGICPPTKSVWDDLPGEVDQIWAECYTYWLLGEELFLRSDVEKLAQLQQEEHRESSGKEGVILEFLERPVPENWGQLSIHARKIYLQNGQTEEGIELIPRDKVCALEVWVECFNGDVKHMRRSDSAEINAILSNAKGWQKNKSTRRFGPYGAQRGYERV